MNIEAARIALLVDAIVSSGGKLLDHCGWQVEPLKAPKSGPYTWVTGGLGRFDALTPEQLTAVIAVVGQEMADVAGLATSATIAARANPDAGKAQAAMVAKTGRFAPKSQEVGSGIRHGFAD
jgi:hypothetical protein